MELDYFYGQQADQFTFYRIPKALFTEERFRSISMDAKVLYGILLDRMALSRRNGWLDKNERVYIIFTTEQIMEALNCANQKATKLLSELESKCGLIERRRQGLGKPNIIYVKNFVENSVNKTLKDVENSVGSLKSQIQNPENHDSATMKITNQESRKSGCSNTDRNQTDLSETYPIFSAPSAGSESDGMAERTKYRNYFEKTLGIRKLIERNPDEEDTIEGMLDILVDTVCTKRAMIRVAGDDKPAEVVKGRLMKLEPAHIGYVLQCLNENNAKVKNMRQYLLASLYNAPTTMSAYYQAMVNNDFANKEKKSGWR
jgi:hypothetical protein